MTRKKLDNRIRTLIENGVALKRRSLFVVVGDKSKDEVVILHHILSKSVVKARPSVLWCYKKELGFSSHRKKRMRQLKKRLQSGKDVNEEDPFELFISSTQIRYCYYSETHKILGNTYGMCVLQDFEALTPNLLARTIETVEGGGLVVIMLQSLSSLRQLYTMTMDVHARYRTEAHKDIVARFNERFILSLASCKSCLVVDDQLNILPISADTVNLQAVPASTKNEIPPNEAELKSLKESLQDTQPIGVVINLCRTLDQARCLLKFFDVITEKTLRATVSLTAARGRGKSAASGLAIAGAVAFGYSNIFVTSPSPENLKTLFEFVFKGFDALEYQEHMDYELIQSTNPEFNKAIIRVNIFREHRQTIQYIHPSDAAKLGQAELLVIDEAAAIPLPLVKQLFGPYLVFMSSTINGYEGTGRSLSLKLIQQLREQTAPISAENTKKSDSANAEGKLLSASGRSLTELVLDESIRYAPGDHVESWLNQLLCLDASIVKKINSGCPSPLECDLYYVNRDTLFCFHKASEAFLQRLMSIYVAAHYKNSPNDLQMLSDAPAHQLYVLLGPVSPDQSTLPEILCVVQVCLEGEIAKSSVGESLSQGKRPSGDMIPWTVAQQFQDNDFPSLSGARIVRIATHPDYQSMGYGSRTIQLLEYYFEGKIAYIGDSASGEENSNENVTEGKILLEEHVVPRKNLPPLLLKLSERRAMKLDWLGVSFGLTNNLLKFWKKAGFVPVYLRQTTNDLTGEHSCIMLKKLHDNEKVDQIWLKAYFVDFRRRFLSLLAFQFSSFPPALALNMAQSKLVENCAENLNRSELSYHVTNYDLKRLEMYGQNLVDYHLVTDLLPTIAFLCFSQKLNLHFSLLQSAILMGIGLQHKTVETLSKELDLPATQLLGLFNKTIRKIVQVLNSICSAAVEQKMSIEQRAIVKPTEQTLDDDLRQSEKEINRKLAREKRKLLAEKDEKNESGSIVMNDLMENYVIKGTDDDWNSALKNTESGEGHVDGSLISVKRQSETVNSEKKRTKLSLDNLVPPSSKEKKHKNKRRSRF